MEQSKIDPELHFMIIYLCFKFESNTLHGTDRMDSGDIICRPTENGVGGWGRGWGGGGGGEGGDKKK